MRDALALASATLLAAPATAQQEPWSIDAAVLYYSEGGERVQALEPVVAASRVFDDDSALSLKIVADSLTGASPNGAVVTDIPQTFTRPSGRGQYTVAAGELPLDDTFKDTRVALSADYSWLPERTVTATIGGYLSREYDFDSISVNGSVQWELDQRNTSLGIGVAREQDRLRPVGGVPIEFAEMAGAGDEQPRRGDTESKSITDLLLSLTQVINRDVIVQLSYGTSVASGYNNDPYKLVSLVDPDDGSVLRNIYENRPDQRRRQTLFAQGKINIDGNVASVSWRYLEDDWEIQSHTVDASWRWSFGSGAWLEPRIRWYRQGAAEFYVHALASDAALPAHATADYRLGAFDALTVGLTYGASIGADGQWRLRIEQYEQSDRDTAPGAELVPTVEFPGVTATQITATLSFPW